MGVLKAAMRKAIYFGHDQYLPRDGLVSPSDRECDFVFADRRSFRSPKIIQTNI